MSPFWIRFNNLFADILADVALVNAMLLLQFRAPTVYPYVGSRPIVIIEFAEEMRIPEPGNSACT